MIGSSKTLSLTKSWGSSIFSRNPTKNPHFYNWNSVYINYCDGTGKSKSYDQQYYKDIRVLKLIQYSRMVETYILEGKQILKE
jgi:hypothetical protein